MTRPFEYRNPDGSLRLDELLGEKYVRHYIRILESSERQFAEMQLTAAVATAVPEAPDEHWYAWAEPPRGEPVDGYVLQHQGSGPDACSSSTAVALLPEIIWDVCGYYRRLGFHWTEFRQVTVKAIRMRYLSLDPRQEDADLYYAACQLRDPVIRRAYDMQPLGGLFLGDRDVRAMLERHAAREAARRTAEALAAGWRDEEPITQGEVLAEWGFDKNGLSAADARERLRERYSAPEDETGTGLGATLSVWDRQWSYYRLADPRDPDWASQGAVAGALEQWQVLLCAVLSEHGVTVQFSVGIWPGPGPRVWRDSNRSCIFFTDGEEVTRSTAAEAVHGYLAIRETSGKPAGNQREGNHAKHDRGRRSRRSDL